MLGVIVWPCWWWWCHWWCRLAFSSSSYGPGAPAIHPTSSGSSAWLRVLCRPLFFCRQVVFTRSVALALPVVVLALWVCIVVVPHFAVIASIVPPVIHPTSSCSWGWRRVVCLALSFWGRSGVLGPFLGVVGARRHPLTLPTLQADACSGGNGWWVGVVMGSSFGRVWVCQCEVVCVRGVLCAYWVGSPLLGSPGVPLRPLSLCKQPHIPFEWGGGGLVGCVRAFRVFCRRRSLLVEYNLKIKRIQLVNW